MKPPFECAETTLIGGIMKNPEQLVACMKYVRGNDFLADEKNLCWQLILEAAATGIDLEPGAVYLMYVQKMGKDGKIVDEQNLKIFDVLQNAFLKAPVSLNLTWYAKEVKKASVARKIASLSAEIAKRASQGLSSPDLLAEIESERLENSDLFDDISTTMQKTMDSFEDAFGKNDKILNSGYKPLDKIMGQFSPGDLTYLAARPGMGKTAFMLNLLVNFSKSGKKCAVLSLEMPNEQLIGRLVAMQCGISPREAITGDLSDSEFNKFQKAFYDVVELVPNSHFANTDLNPIQLEAEIKSLVAQNKVDVLFVDYLQLFSTDEKFQTREQEVSSVSKTMKKMAKKYGISVICLAQLNRAVEHRPDKKPTLADLRDSGSIEQDADQILMLKRPKYYDSNAADTLEIYVAKNRHGATGDCVLGADMRKGVFFEMDHHQGF